MTKRNYTRNRKQKVQDDNWREEQQKFYGCILWKELRDSVMVERHGLCEECLKNGIITAATVVHHRVHVGPENINDPSITLNPDNLVCLCDRHHKLAHSRERRYYIKKDGEVVLLSDSDSPSF